MWDRAKSFLSLLADLLQVISFFGVAPATLVALLAATLAFLTDVPWFYGFVGTVLVFFVALTVSRQFMVRVGTLALPEAARLAYEELRGTLWAEAAERMRSKSTPDAILDYIATGIAMEIPILGRFPPSTRLEPISPKVLNAGSIVGGAATLQLRDRHNSMYVDLAVRRRELRKAIATMKREAKATSSI